jgi:hypothetical protein
MMAWDEGIHLRTRANLVIGVDLDGVCADFYAACGK